MRPNEARDRRGVTCMRKIRLGCVASLAVGLVLLGVPATSHADALYTFTQDNCGSGGGCGGGPFGTVTVQDNGNNSLTFTVALSSNNFFISTGQHQTFDFRLANTDVSITPVSGFTQLTNPPFHNDGTGNN